VPEPTGHPGSDQIVRRDRLFKEIEPLSFHLQVRAAIRPVVAQGKESAGGVNVNAIFLVREMRAARAARRKNQIRFAAIGRNPDQISIAGLSAIECAVFTVVGIAAQQNNLGAVGGKNRVAVNRQGL